MADIVPGTVITFDLEDDKVQELKSGSTGTVENGATIIDIPGE